MKLTRAADYGIRLLTHLASYKKENNTTAELATRLGIPFNHMAKLVHILSKKGFLLTRKGKGGGIKIALNPKDISMYDVIYAIEGSVVLSDCILHQDICPFGKKCKVRKVFSLISGNMEKML